MNLFKNSKLLIFLLAVILFGTILVVKNSLDNQSNNVEVQSWNSITKSVKNVANKSEKTSEKEYNKASKTSEKEYNKASKTLEKEYNKASKDLDSVV